MCDTKESKRTLSEKKVLTKNVRTLTLTNARVCSEVAGLPEIKCATKKVRFLLCHL